MEHCQVPKARRTGGTSWSNCVFISVLGSKWPLGTSEYPFNFMLAFLLVWMGTEDKTVFSAVMSQMQKKKNLFPLSCVIRNEKWVGKSGNAEFKISLGSLLFYENKQTKGCEQPPASICSSSSLLPSCWALPVPGRGVLQHRAITDRNVYLTNVLKPVCTSSVSFCFSVLCISCVCGFA